VTQRECASVFAIVFVTLLAVGNFGCGGGHVTPPPPVTVTVSPVTATVQAGGC
jgi:hypothetical protein